MSNKIRNLEATRIHRPVTLGQCTDTLEAWSIAVVDIIFGVNLLPTYVAPRLLWHR